MSNRCFQYYEYSTQQHNIELYLPRETVFIEKKEVKKSKECGTLSSLSLSLEFQFHAREIRDERERENLLPVGLELEKKRKRQRVQSAMQLTKANSIFAKNKL